jgi:hypothetical protein
LAKVYPNEYISKGEYTILRLTSEKYGEFDFLIDNEDVDKCKNFHWSLERIFQKDCGHLSYYAGCNMYTGEDDKKHNVLLHRFIMNAPKGMFVDHIYGDTLDTRKVKLRICTFQENCRNRKLDKSNTSGYRGVTWSKKDHKYMAYIHLESGRKFKNLGYYDDPAVAFQKRLEAEQRYFRGFIVTNELI